VGVVHCSLHTGDVHRRPRFLCCLWRGCEVISCLAVIIGGGNVLMLNGDSAPKQPADDPGQCWERATICCHGVAGNRQLPKVSVTVAEWDKPHHQGRFP